MVFSLKSTFSLVVFRNCRQKYKIFAVCRWCVRASDNAISKVYIFHLRIFLYETQKDLHNEAFWEGKFSYHFSSHPWVMGSPWFKNWSINMARTEVHIQTDVLCALLYRYKNSLNISRDFLFLMTNSRFYLISLRLFHPQLKKLQKGSNIL